MEIHKSAPRTFALTHLSFASYIKFSLLVSSCLGSVAGLIAFFLDVVAGIDISFRIGWFFVDGRLLGVVLLFVSPFLFVIVGFLGSLTSYPIFLWALKKIEGIQIVGE